MSPDPDSLGSRLGLLGIPFKRRRGPKARTLGNSPVPGEQTHASKPEPQAEGNRVFYRQNRVPSPRGSGFRQFRSVSVHVQNHELRETHLFSASKPMLQSPKRKLRETALFEPRRGFPRLAARASRNSVLASCRSKSTNCGQLTSSRRATPCFEARSAS